MSVVLARIDDRLVHGQVVIGWIPHVRAQVVVVASDSAASDDTQRALMRMAVPDDVELQVLSVAAAAKFLGSAEPRRVLALAPGPAEMLALIEGGAAVTQVNVGGLHYTAGRVQLGKAIFLSEEDKAALRRIAALGVALEGRGLPADKSEDILELLGAPAGAR